LGKFYSIKIPTLLAEWKEVKECCSA